VPPPADSLVLRQLAGSAVGATSGLSYNAGRQSRGGAVVIAHTPVDADEAGLAALMAAAQGGDQAAYRRVLHLSVPLIQRAARRAGVPPSGVDDVVQEVLIAVHRMLATFDPSRSYEAWLSAIAKRRSIDFLRSSGRRASREVHEPIAYENHAADIDVAAGEEQRHENIRLGEAVATLPEGQREAVQVLAYAERSLEEGAALTGRSKTALKVNLHRAIRSLRTRLSGSE
jgi:RNA polymerase sigma factor (sigma-70 family)